MSAAFGRRLFAAGACVFAAYACSGERKGVGKSEEPDDAGTSGATSPTGGSSGRGGVSSGGTGATGNEGGEDVGGSPTGATSGGGAGGAGAGGAGSGGASAGAGAGGAGSGAGSGGGETGGAGRAGGAAGSGAPCPSIQALFPPVVPTGQTSGLAGTASPVGAPLRSFDGYLIQLPCVDTSCNTCAGGGWVYGGITTPCAPTSTGSSFNAIQNFAVGGVPGVRYRATLHFYGVVEPKNYGNGATRQAGATPSSNLDSGASPAPWGYAAGYPPHTQSDFTTHGIHVVDNLGADVCSYYVNAAILEETATLILNYERTIDVIGGGLIRVRTYDRECRYVKNCFAGGSQGECSATGCEGKARLVDVSAAMPQPAGLVQPGLGNDDGNSGQWLYIDVTAVTCSPTALGCNGAPM